MSDRDAVWNRAYDVIVVGGGTAGAIVAARLAEDDGLAVLLLEAGPAPDESRLPQALAAAGFPVLEGYNWDFEARLRATGVGESIRFPYPLAKILGGGSAINGSVAMHARQSDYEQWAAVAGPWWSWDKVRSWLAFPRRAADGRGADPDGASNMNGQSHGSPLQYAFFAACADKGFPGIDTACSSEAGAGPVPLNSSGGRRFSTASYLRQARGRGNLTVLAECEVIRLIVAGGSGSARAAGVQARTQRRSGTLSCARVVLCAGAIGSPLLLMRSGIGPAAEIEQTGTRVTLNLPGVGRNLLDHPVVTLWTIPDGGAAGGSLHEGMLQFASGSSSLCDLQLFLLAGVASAHLRHPGALDGVAQVSGISVVVATPTSAGHVDPPRSDAGKPDIVLNCLDSGDDLRRMMTGVRAAWDIIHSSQLGSLLGRPATCSSRVIASDVMLERMIRTTVRASWHPVGTLRMGHAGDAHAVVGEYGLVHGSDNIYVADASLLPSAPSVPTNLTCMLIGERIAAQLRGR